MRALNVLPSPSFAAVSFAALSFMTAALTVSTSVEAQPAEPSPPTPPSSSAEPPSQASAPPPAAPPAGVADSPAPPPPTPPPSERHEPIPSFSPPPPPGALHHADEPVERVGQRPAKDGFRDRYVLETARIAPLVPNKNFVLLSMHGEYELRFRAMNDLRLQPPVRDPSDEAKVLGQNKYLYHWLRINPRLDIGEDVSVVGQIDLPRGLVVGDTTRYVSAAREPLDEYRWYDVHPRELYVEWRSPIGTLRVGQQTSNWGMGILANDGNHPQMFGDTNYGSLTERVLFATTPFGKGTPFILVAAGDLIFQDNTADLVDGDRAMQGVVAALYRTDSAEIGLYGVARHQWRHEESIDQYTPYGNYLTVGVVDVEGKLRGKIPGTDAYVYGQAEAATIFGGTSFIRSAYNNTLDPTAKRDMEKILSFGATATVGFVHTRKTSDDVWGDIVAELEFGYASGDADPYDGATHRFTMDPNHHVGLVLFDHVMGWKTARAATIAQDSRVVNRANPGLEFLSSNGGIFGATYLNPRIIARPRRWVDVKLGFVIAQASADEVDPYHAGALGSFTNYDGGDPTSRDLGLEIDTGFDFRIPLAETIKLEVGAEGGVLFPGHAFDDATGVGLDNQYLLNTKLGMQF